MHCDNTKLSKHESTFQPTEGRISQHFNTSYSKIYIEYETNLAFHWLFKYTCTVKLSAISFKTCTVEYFIRKLENSKFLSLFFFSAKKFFPITFLGSILWIAAFSYLMVWWATVTGNTVGIPPEVDTVSIVPPPLRHNILKLFFLVHKIMPIQNWESKLTLSGGRHD